MKGMEDTVKDADKCTALTKPFKTQPVDELIKELSAWIDTDFLATSLWNVAVDVGIPLSLARLRVLWLRYQDMLEIDLTEIAETYAYEEKLIPSPDEKNEDKEEPKAHVRDNVVQENQACDG